MQITIELDDAKTDEEKALAAIIDDMQTKSHKLKWDVNLQEQAIGEILIRTLTLTFVSKKTIPTKKLEVKSENRN